MHKWMLLLLVGITPCLAAEGNTVESVNRSSAASGLAAQTDETDLEKLRSLPSGDFDGRNKKIITNDERYQHARRASYSAREFAILSL